MQAIQSQPITTKKELRLIVAVFDDQWNPIKFEKLPENPKKRKLIVNPDEYYYFNSFWNQSGLDKRLKSCLTLRFKDKIIRNGCFEWSITHKAFVLQNYVNLMADAFQTGYPLELWRSVWNVSNSGTLREEIFGMILPPPGFFIYN